MRKILEAAALRSKAVEIEGEQFVCQEMTGAESLEFSTKLSKNREAAYSWLFLQKVKMPGGLPAFTAEEAGALSVGAARVFLPLFIACTGFVDQEKKASTPTSDSTIESPSPRDEPWPSSSTASPLES